MSEIVQTLWTARDEHDPLATGFYPVVTHDGNHSYRLWEDGSWWMFSCHDNEWALVPNNSFAYWAHVPGPSVLRLKAEGTA